jgi:HEAT repeat protein
VGAAAFAVAVGCSATTEALSVSVGEGRVSLEAEGEPLTQVLEELARRANITVFFEKGAREAPADVAVRARFDGVPLEDAVRRLLRDRNFILVHSATGLAEVWVYDKEGKREFARLGREAGPPERSTRRTDRAAGRDADAIPTAQLLERIRGAGDPDERVQAIEDLAASADDVVVRDAAVEVLQRESNPQVLESALESLAGLPAVPVDALLEFIGRDRTPELRSRAIELLGEHGGRDPRVRQVLQNLARTERNEDVRDAARSALEDLAGD